MTAEELWEESGLSGDHEAWAFGEAPDKLAELVVQEIKTATCSAYDLYQINNEPIPQAGEYSIILDSREEAVCIIKTLKVYVTEFSNVSEEHAFPHSPPGRNSCSYICEHGVLPRPDRTQKCISASDLS